MTEFSIYTKDTAPTGSIPTLEAAEKKFGFIPNLLGELAESPVAVEAYLSLSGTFGKSTLTPAEQQVVLLTTSYENECHYCMAAHTGGAKMAKLDEGAIQALRAGEPIADPKIEALRGFTRKLVVNRGWVQPADIDSFVAAGYTRANVFEVITGVALKTISNYTNHVAETPLDDKLAALKWDKPAKAA
ncbi:MAG: carboxymuconolactone decarboxylase family protein [Alphaproteobacteria bacterium]|nr:carboxymuconolactone decarboxylase family protein [Alphaproteobacteria bacterium]